MQVSVSGKQINIGNALSEHVEHSLQDKVTKYFDRAVDAAVVFSRESHLFVCDVRVNEGTGVGGAIKASGKADDIYAAFDQSASRVEKQLRRYKRRLKNHHHHNINREEGALATAVGADIVPLNATKYVILDDGQELSSEVDEDTPLIIAEKQTCVERLTVSDAVMRMDLADLPALMFINKKSGRFNIVYRRKDGNVSWVEAEAA